MKQRGRKSTDAALVVAGVESIPRQSPPTELSAYEAEMWMKVVNTKPSDWFQGDTIPLLRSYVRHCYQAAKIDSEMDKLIDRDFKDESGVSTVGTQFDTLTKMRDRESRQLTSLARSMRLTQQAQVHPEKAGTIVRKSTKASPWAS